LIYLIRCEQDTESLKAGWVKIGTTRRLSARLKQIAAEIGHTPTVLAVLDGSYAEERALHEKFDHTREWSEWFSPCDDLMRLIKTEGRPWNGEDEVPLSSLGRPVKVDSGVVTKAKLVADTRDITLAEYLTELLRVPVDRDFSKAVRSIDKPESKE
jgi:predicted NBD/HSP70 family sugar kinase